MNINWTNRPTEIINWESDVDYVMFVDENGDNDISRILKFISQRKDIDINDKFFTITGCILKKTDYIEAKKELNNLKNKYWNNGNFDYDGKIQKVCFHSREIRKRIGPFNPSIINYSEFMNDLSELIKKLNYTIISVSINKEDYLLKHYNYNVYNTAMVFLIQRYIYVMKNNCRGLIMLEARGKKEDKILLDEMKHIIFDTGIGNISSHELQQKIAGIYFNPKWNTSYSDTFSGLEIADLSSYPIHKYIRNNNKDLAFNIIETKIDKYPNYKNKGLKLFP